MLFGEELAGRFKNLFGFFLVVARQRILADQARGARGQRIEHNEQFDLGVLAEKGRTGSHEREGIFTVAAAVDRNENLHMFFPFLKFFRSAVLRGEHDDPQKKNT